jgi:hypothetical protein
VGEFIEIKPPFSQAPSAKNRGFALKFLGTLVPQIIGVKLRVAFAATCEVRGAWFLYDYAMVSNINSD